MMTHDPMCALDYVYGIPIHCDCNLIARVRADERERLRAQVEAWGDPEDEWDAAEKFDAIQRLLGGESDE